MKQVRNKLKHMLSLVVYGVLLVFTPPKYAKRPQQDIVIVSLAALGDFIIFCSAAQMLHEQGRRLTLVCRKEIGIEEFAQMTGYFDEVIELPHGFRHRISNLKRLRRLSVKTVLVAPVSRHILSDLYAMAIPAQQRILPDTMLSCSLPRLKRAVDQRTDLLIPIDTTLELERYEQYLRGGGFELGKLMPFHFPWVVNRIPPKVTTLGIFPGAGGGRAKQWPIERFAQVANELQKEHTCCVKVFGTAKERLLGDQLCALITVPCENLCGCTDIPKLVSAMKEFSLVLANDSGSAHLVIACGVPTVVICGGWEYGRFYPNPRLPENCTPLVVSPQEYSCIPCGKSCPVCVRDDTVPCVLATSAETALTAARVLMNHFT